MKYINNNCEKLAAAWPGAKTVNNIDELNQIVIPKTLLIKQDGTTLLLLDCPWDEHGLAVQYIPAVSIGSQDIYLQVDEKGLATNTFSERKIYAVVGQSNINAEKLKRFACLLPPLAQQKRIVAKREELLPLCTRQK